MKKHINQCACGSDEFVSKPNRYDIYQIIDGKLELIESAFTQDGIKLFCRDCGKKLKNADVLVSA